MDLVELQTQFDSLSSWRKRELIQAYALAENATTDAARKYLCRAWVLMMYAHCDNFLKEATKIYLNYCKSNSLNAVKLEAIWLALRGKENITEGAVENYKSFRSYCSISGWDFYDQRLLNEIFKKKSFQYNFLRFISDWVLQIEFDHTEMLDFCNHLKVKRDAIAHGEESYIESVPDCLHWHQSTLRFFDDLKDSILEAAQAR